jgi:hypothetical protein
VQAGYHCEECEEAAFFATTRAELQWLKRRHHIVAEVASHLSSGLDGWMTDGLEFLDKHAAHSIIIVVR